MRFHGDPVQWRIQWHRAARSFRDLTEATWKRLYPRGRT